MPLPARDTPCFANLSQVRETLGVSVSERRLICVIDDEAAVAALAARILEPHGFAVQCYTNAQEFLEAFDDQAVSCVVTDLRMPGIDGMELQKRLRDQGSIVSLIVLTGHADVRTAVRMMEDGASTLLEKPYNPDEFVQAVQKAVERSEARRVDYEATRVAQSRFETLNEAERQVLDCVIAGLPNKAIAMKLDISMRTVDRRRHNVFRKMGVDSVSELATMVARLRTDEGPTRDR